MIPRVNGTIGFTYYHYLKEYNLFPREFIYHFLYASLDTPSEVKTIFMLLFENSKSSKEISYPSKLFFVDCKPFAS